MMVQQYQQGRFELLRKLLVVKYGALPLWAEKRLANASADEVDQWAVGILTASSLEELLKS